MKEATKYTKQGLVFASAWGIFIALGTAGAFASSTAANESIQIDSEGYETTLRENDFADGLDGLTVTDGFRGSFADGQVINESNERSVQGPDERTRIFDTTTYPNRAIGRLAVGCTGTLIGPRVVLTAGHCVYDLKKKEWIKNLDFSPGQNGKSFPYGTVKWKTATTTKSYTEKGKTEWDFAVVVLEQPIGNQVGFMGYSYNDGLKSVNININGYPGDKEAGTMWHSYCPTSSIATDLIKYLCDTYPGNSGSAIYEYIAKTSERKILGIHTTGLTTYNYGTRLTKAKFAKLNGWKTANP